MSEEKSTYKRILLATSVFGSMQFINLFFSFVKHKLLSIFIGAEGYGIFGMLNSIVDLIKSISGLSIDNSAVKAIASQENSDFNAQVVLKLSLLTGLLGCLVTVLFSPIISKYLYFTYDYWYLIVFLGLAVFFKQIATAFIAILQGKSLFKKLAKSNLLSNGLGLLFTIPFFYFFKKDFIIPAIIISALVNMIVGWFFVKKIKVLNALLTFREAVSQGKEIIYFGSLLMIMSFLPLLVNYTLQILINKQDGIENVGLFNVANIILNTYVGFLFNAMSLEYYPRLVSLEKNNNKVAITVKQQAIVTTLLIVPVVIFFIGFGEFIIQFLFSKEFLEVNQLLQWAVIGMFFKAISFSIGYLFIAKADSKVFMKTSLGFNILYFLMLYFGYQIGAFKGMGIAIAIYFFLHLTGVYIIAKKRYQMTFFEKKDIVLFVSQFLTLLVALFIMHLSSQIHLYLITILLILSSSYTFYEINKLVVLKDLFKK